MGRPLGQFKQATSARLASFVLDGETIVVPVKDCPMCAGTGEVEDFELAMPPVIDAVEFRREQYGWTASKMASELGLTRGHYSEFTHGKRGLPLNARIKAHALGVPAAILLAERGNNGRGDGKD